MRSYLFSLLQDRFRKRDFKAFSAAHPHDWLVWEPGLWRPARRGHETVATPNPSRAALPSGSESLAISLLVTEAKFSLSLGRGEDSDIAINDGTLSQLHVVLMAAGPGRWTVRDANSRNGSWIGEAKLTPGRPAALAEGATLRAGSVLLTFHDSAGLFRRIQAGA